MQVTNALGTIATVYGLASVTAPLLQLRRIRRRGSAEDVSLGTLAIGVTGSTIWLLYGWTLANMALIVVDLGTLVTGAATIACAIHLRRRVAAQNRMLPAPVSSDQISRGIPLPARRVTAARRPLPRRHPAVPARRAMVAVRSRRAV